MASSWLSRSGDHQGHGSASCHSHLLRELVQFLFNSSAMSKAAVRTMRIIALPLSSARGSKSKTILDTYYHFVTAPPHVSDSAKLSWPAWGIGKAQGIWTDFGKAKKGSWKVRCAVIKPRKIFAHTSCS